MELAGGRVMSMNEMRTVLSNIPPGAIRAVVPNITPDPDTGIGHWTDAQIATAIRGGPRPNGTFIGPPIPIALYRGISDHDLAAIIAYLRAVPPIHNAVTQHSSYPFPIDPLGRPVEHIADPADNPIARGAYIAGPLAHCIDATHHRCRLSSAIGRGRAQVACQLRVRGVSWLPQTSRRTRSMVSVIGPTSRYAMPLPKASPQMATNCCRRWAPALRSIPKSARTICATSSLTYGHFLRSSLPVCNAMVEAAQ